MKQEFIEIEITNWDRYNPRKDIKMARWFAVSNRLLEDPAIDNLTAEEFRAWIYILSQASQKMSATVQIYFSHATRFCRITPKVIQATLSKMVASNAVTVREQIRTPNERKRHIRVLDPNATEQNRTRHNKTEQNTPESSVAARSLVFGDLLVDDFMSSVSEEMRHAWLSSYPEDWIRDEIKKAKVWCLANKSKAPKSNPARFLTNWFARGWESYRKTLPSVVAARAVVIPEDMKKYFEDFRGDDGGVA